MNIPAIVQKDVFLKLILNIQKNYVNYTQWLSFNPRLNRIKREVSEYQQKIFYNIPIGTGKKLVPR